MNDQNILVKIAMRILSTEMPYSKYILVSGIYHNAVKLGKVGEEYMGDAADILNLLEDDTFNINWDLSPTEIFNYITNTILLEDEMFNEISLLVLGVPALILNIKATSIN